MLRVLLDTNVLLDLALRREPWLTEARSMWDARDAREIICYVPASALTDLYYISRKQVGNVQAGQVVRNCLANFEICTVNRLVLEYALTLPGNDFENNVMIACALAETVDLIVTRNVGDFKHSPIQAVEPPGVLKHL